jgi:hypothetical protein
VKIRGNALEFRRDIGCMGRSREVVTKSSRRTYDVQMLPYGRARPKVGVPAEVPEAFCDTLVASTCSTLSSGISNPNRLGLSGLPMSWHHRSTSSQLIVHLGGDDRCWAEAPSGDEHPQGYRALYSAAPKCLKLIRRRARPPTHLS